MRASQRFSYRWFCVLLTCFLCPMLPQAQPVQDTSPLLIVRGISSKAVRLTASDLEKLPHRSAKIRGKSGDEITYSGVALSDVLKRAGLDFEANLHGRALTRYLLVEAADQYRIVFALPEFDPTFTDRLVLLATRRDGKPISDTEGPLRMIVPDEKRQARWVRQVRVLSIMDAVPPAERNKKP